MKDILTKSLIQDVMKGLNPEDAAELAVVMRVTSSSIKRFLSTDKTRKRKRKLEKKARKINRVIR